MTPLINKYKVKLNNNLHFKEILFGSVNTIVLKVIGMLLGLGVTLIIAKTYGAEGIGLYNLSVRTISLMAIVSTLGISTSILRYVGQFNRKGTEDKLKLLFRHSVQLVLPLSVILGILLFLTSDLIANGLFHNIKYIEPLRILSITIPLMAMLNISVQFIRGLKAIKISESLRSVSRPVINIILLITMGLFIHHYLLPIFTFTMAIIITSIMALIFIFRKIKNISTTANSTFTKNELLKTSFPMLIIAIFSFLQTNISIYFLEAYTSTDQVGIFSVALRLASLITLVLLAVNTISAPKFSELYWANKHRDLQKVIFFSTKLIFIFSSIIAIAIILLANTALNLFGEAFTQGKVVLIILCLGSIINSFTGSVRLLLNMTNLQNILRNVMLLMFPLNILLNITVVPVYGMVGAAIVNTFTFSLLNIVCSIIVYKKLSLLTIYIPFLSIKIINKYLIK